MSKVTDGSSETPDQAPAKGRPRRNARRGRPPTVETVAELAGVSRQTVSNVINAPERVLPGTRERVQKAIDDLNYRPNRLGSALQSRAARAFAYRCHLSEDEENLLLDRFLHELCRAAAIRRHTIVLVSPTDVDDEISTYDDMFHTGAVDGIVISGTFPADRRLDAIRRNKIPSVSFGRDWDHPEVNGWVDIDGAAGIAQAVQHFAGQGHRAIAWIGDTRGGAVSDRRAGYRTTIDDLGFVRLELESGTSIEDATDGALQALRGSNPPTAFVCSNDVIAVGCARAATLLDLEIGAQIGIIGFDDTRLARVTSPHLSSIRQPTERVAGLLIDGLIDAVTTGLEMPSQILAPRLVHRGSS